MRARSGTGMLMALSLAALLVAFSSGASPSATPTAMPSPAVVPIATPDVTPAPSPIPTPSPTPAPAASSAAAPSMPAEFVGTWTTKPDDPSQDMWQQAFVILDGCVLGQECGGFHSADIPMGFPLVVAHIRGATVVLDVGESPEEDCRFSGFGSGQTLTPNGDGTLNWSTADGWSATLYPFSGRLDG